MLVFGDREECFIWYFSYRNIGAKYSSLEQVSNERQAIYNFHQNGAFNLFYTKKLNLAMKNLHIKKSLRMWTLLEFILPVTIDWSIAVWFKLLQLGLFLDHTRLSHWILDGDTSHTNLLTFALTEENYADTTVLLCVSMTTPWNIMDQLQNWASLLQVEEL